MALIAVTGASGLLGSNLVRLLCECGHKVHCTRRSTSKVRHLDDLPLCWFEADITHSESLDSAFRGCEAVIHCAATVGYGPTIDKQIELNNVVGSCNVLEAAKRCAVKRLVHCSSVDALGISPEGAVSDEATKWNWDSHGIGYGYARSKLAAERALLERANGAIDVIIVNPTFLIGPYDTKPSSGKLTLQIAKRTLFFYPTGSNNFVDVRDVARGMLLALERGRAGERYILGGENLSYRDFFLKVLRCAKKPEMLFPLPKMIARIVGKLGDLYEALSSNPCDFNSQLTNLGYFNHQFTSAKAIRELGYHPGLIEDAIRDSIIWFNQATPGILSKWR